MERSPGSTLKNKEEKKQEHANSHRQAETAETDRDSSDVCRKYARERKASTVLRFAPKTSHQSEGSVEAVHGHIQGLARCYQTQIESNTDIQLSATSFAI